MSLLQQHDPEALFGQHNGSRRAGGAAAHHQDIAGARRRVRGLNITSREGIYPARRVSNQGPR